MHRVNIGKLSQPSICGFVGDAVVMHIATDSLRALKHWRHCSRSEQLRLLNLSGPTLRRKGAEIRRAIIAYEERLDQANADLVQPFAASAMFAKGTH